MPIYDAMHVRFPPNSQYKSKQKQKLERWLVGLEFTRENNQNNYGFGTKVWILEKKSFSITYSLFCSFNLWAAVMTFRVPRLMSLSVRSGTMAQEPKNLLSPSNMMQDQGNSSGLAWPFSKLKRGLKLLWPHWSLFPKFRMFSRHPCCQFTGACLIWSGERQVPNSFNARVSCGS